ncbi:MAG: type II toxin-antitoxin system prevent-host-death family antitoxin [Desulfuromonadales bacterium]|nr:type II toxin-antitoxin system prevent-host-death family antitoxin [Desulfuromonadales bacterium]
MKIITATEANRHFSEILKEASEGEEIQIEWRGKLIAKLTPARKVDKSQLSARQGLFERLRKSEPVVIGDWTREGLYDR